MKRGEGEPDGKRSVRRQGASGVRYLPFSVRKVRSGIPVDKSDQNSAAILPGIHFRPGRPIAQFQGDGARMQVGGGR